MVKRVLKTVALLAAAMWSRDTHGIRAPQPKFVVKMLRESGALVNDTGMVFPAGSPWCRFHVDRSGFPVERLASGRWAYVADDDEQVPAKRRLEREPLLLGEHDPRELYGEGERRALTQRATRKCDPEGAEQRVPADPNAPKPRLRPARDGKSGRTGRELDASGSRRNLVLLIRFRDHVDRALPALDKFQGMMTSTGKDATYWPTGSVRSYYAAQSNGKLDLESTVLDWVTVPQSEAEAASGKSGLGLDASGSSPLHNAILYALDFYAQSVNFADFDLDKDNNIDGFTVIHSGYAAEWGNSDQYGTPESSRIWSH